jgi:septum formation protein
MPPSLPSFVPAGSVNPLSTRRPELILGSTSAYRRALLERLRLEFRVVAPDVDEAPVHGEPPASTAQRLALAKAVAVAGRHPNAVVIGSDQVADLGGKHIGKPGTHDNAVTQLTEMSGKTVVFHTAVSVVRLDRQFAQTALAQAKVQFRQLPRSEIENYLQIEKPYDCAGSAKSEGLGIALLESIESDDPTTLVGLPLMRTCRLLRAAGFDVP